MKGMHRYLFVMRLTRVESRHEPAIWRHRRIMLYGRQDVDAYRRALALGADGLPIGTYTLTLLDMERLDE